MGHANVACGFSGISMSNDRVVFVPLRKRKFADAIWCSKIISNDGPFGLYEMYMLPLYGEHDTYGGLEDIERNAHVEMLEKFFGANIDAIFSAMNGQSRLASFDDHFNFSGGRRPYGDDKDKDRPYGMFVHRDVWDEFASKTFCEYPSHIVATAWNDGDLNTIALEMMGFVLTQEVSNDKRYKFTYRHPEIDNFALSSDGTWVQFLDVQAHAYHPKGLAKVVRDHRGYEFSDEVKAKFDVRPAVLSFKSRIRSFEDDDIVKALTDDAPGVDLTALKRALRAVRGRHSHPISWTESSATQELYENVLCEEWFADVSVDMYTIIRNCWGANKLFAPTFNGPQDGHHATEMWLHEIALRVLKEEQRKRDDFDD